MTSTTLDLTRFQALSFDCYGTLIDWEAGIGAVLSEWAAEQGLTLTTEELLLAYGDNEVVVERQTPTVLYPEILAGSFRRIGTDLGKPVSDTWAARLGASVPDWPAFPDSAEALTRLAQRYQLIILSNVHRAGFAGSNQHLRGDFAAIITAEDVGAYKPADNHFRALDATLPELGVARDELLHVAQSLFHDHVPAKREGLPSVWINRRHAQPGWGATPQPSEAWSYSLEFTSMAAFADAVDAAFDAATTSKEQAREPLTDRVRAALAAQPSIREVRMFGKVAFLVNEKMVVAVGADDLLVRVDPDRHTELTDRPGAAQAEMGVGRSMGPGWISVTEGALTDDDLQFWLGVALQYNARVAH